MPGVRIIPEPISPHSTVTEEIEAGVGAAMDAIVAALTKPLTAEEKSSKQKEAEKSSRIVFKGNIEEINQFFYKRDGVTAYP